MCGIRSVINNLSVININCLNIIKAPNTHLIRTMVPKIVRKLFRQWKNLRPRSSRSEENVESVNQSLKDFWPFPSQNGQCLKCSFMTKLYMSPHLQDTVVART